MAGCARDRGALPRMISMSARLGCTYDKGASETEVLCHDRLVQKPKKKKKALESGALHHLALSMGYNSWQYLAPTTGYNS